MKKISSYGHQQDYYVQTDRQKQIRQTRERNTRQTDTKHRYKQMDRIRQTDSVAMYCLEFTSVIALP